MEYSKMREIITRTMSNSALFEVVQVARKQRDEMIANANSGRDSLIVLANERFARDVINAAIDLDNSIRTLDDSEDVYHDEDDG
jgi:hypothetical protein